MSTALAIAATTRVLSQVIEANVEAAGLETLFGSPPYVVSQPPDQLETGADEAMQLSLFLYHIAFNPSWREVGLPSRNGAGVEIDRPPLAVDLHYLLSAYGSGGYQQQILLALGMQALHETPVLARREITGVFTPPPPLIQLDQSLGTAQLASQIELIKVTPEPFSTDDLSKLWTALGGKFRPSAGYEATVVLIEGNAPIQAPPPVISANVVTMPLSEPIVTAVTPTYLPWGPSLSVTLSGSNLAGEDTVVIFGGESSAPQVPTAGPGGTTVTVAVPASLPAGMTSAQVIRQAAVGAPPAKDVVESNPALFYLQPVIRQGPSPPPDDDLITVGPTSPTTPPTTPITVEVDPVLESTQQVQLLLNELSPPPGQAPMSFTFDAQPGQIAGNSVTFTTSATRAGAYLVRVRVDGAESPLRIDPTTKRFAHPTVTL